MESKEFTAKTTEEAVRLASEYFNLPLGRLKVEVINAGSNGILGLFGKKKGKNPGDSHRGQQHQHGGPGSHEGADW